MTSRRSVGIHIIIWLTYAFAVGVLFQLIGLFSLSRAVAFDDGKIQLRTSTIRFADFTLTASRFMPHRWIESAIPNQSKFTRLLDVADSAAQALAISRELVKDSDGFLTPKDLMKSESIRMVTEISNRILPIQERILSHLQGGGGEDSIDLIRNVEVLGLVKASRALLELGLVAESLSGCQKPAKVLVLFTSNSELRSIGGLIGQFALVEMNCNRFTVEKIGTNSELSDNKIFHIMQQEFPGLYYGVNDEWVNSNLLPSGASLGEAWISSYQSQFDINLDAVIAVDTKILAALAESKGGVTAADGTKLTSKEEVDAYLRNGIYFQYPEDQIARKKHLLELTNLIAKGLKLTDLFSPAMFHEFGDLILSNRLYIHAKKNEYDSDVETLNWSSSSRRYIYVGLNNLSGSKFDFYSKIEMSHRYCSNNQQILDISIVNDAKPGAYYPDYVNRRLDTYPSKLDGVLNQIVVSYPADSVKVVAERIPAFSKSAYILGEKENRNLLSVTEFISAGERYRIQFTFKSKNNLTFKMWGVPYRGIKSVPISECA
jgi:hypothetical protein